MQGDDIISQILIIGEELDFPLQDVKNRQTMKDGGWFVDGAPDELDAQKDCGGYGFFGYKRGRSIGYVNATFKGSGTGKLEFGNCGELANSATKVYLNDLLIATAGPNTWPVAIRFDYKRGDILKLTEKRTAGIIKLVSFKIESADVMP